MSSRALNETPWDKRKTEKRDLDEEMGGGAYRIHHLPFSSPPVESEMPLYRWLFCVSVSKSLSSISLIREERMRVGQNWGGGVTWEATNCFDAIGPCLLCLFCTHTPTPLPVLMLNLRVQFILWLEQMAVLKAATFTFVVLMTSFGSCSCNNKQSHDLIPQRTVL